MGKAVKLSKDNIEDILPLTPMQEGMLFYHLKDSDNNYYFEQLCFNISGDISPEAVEKAWNHVAGNNDMLRTVYRWGKLEKPVQIVLKQQYIPIKHYDFSGAGDGKQQLLKEALEKDREEKIDLEAAPFRVMLFKLEENEYEMVISNHHILYDGWSNVILLREFLSAYDSIYAGRELKHSDKSQFKEYIKWLQKQDKKLQEAYWREYLKHFDAKTVLIKECNEENRTGRRQRYAKSLTQGLAERIHRRIKEQKTTLAGLLYGAWGILLQRYGGSEDVIFGTTVSGRTAKIPGIEDMTGLFINTLPLRINAGSGEAAFELVKRVDEALRDREAYESTPLVDIAAQSELHAGQSLFDTIVVIENYPMDKAFNEEYSHIKVNSYRAFESTNYDLTLEISTLNGIEMNFSYNDGIYTTETVQRMAGHYEAVLEGLVEDPAKKLSGIEMLRQEEKRQIIDVFNATHAGYPREKTVHELFEEQAARTPDNIAAVYGNSRLTYRELNEKANRLARILREKGVVPDSIVGIMAEPSLEMITGIMGILKAGGAYLPIDAEYPADRIRYMLEDSGSKLLLVQPQLRDRLVFGGEILELDNERSYAGDGSNPEAAGGPDNLAYVIYTSGSTGRPKGVMIEHKSLQNLCNWHINQFNITQEDRATKYAGFGFDASVWEIFPYLLKGAGLYIISKDILLNIESLNGYMEKNGITVAFLPTQVCEQFMRVGNKSLRLLLTGGDKLRQYKPNSYMLVNNYGPTENTVVTTSCYVTGQMGNIPIGKPVANTQIYIVDRNNSLQPVGVTGELCVSGDGLARGYLNKPELTAEKFVPNPFRPGTRMYRTGDLARWLPDGNIEFLGRMDQQVKIRGFRIELGEIESRLLKHEAVKDAIVISREDDTGDKYMGAYITADRELPVSGLREYLGEELPEYMIPSYFVQLESMPLTPNGKIDRKALPEPDINMRTEAEYEAPGNATEEKLVKIWQEILGAGRIGINDSFFELGGHSLKATSLAARIHKEMNVEIPLREIFKAPVIKKIAEYINAQEEKSFTAIKPIGERPYYESSSAQKRLYTLQQLEQEGTGYNIPAVIEIEGVLDAGRLRAAFRKIVERHEAFRTSFAIVGEEIVQIVQKEVDFEVEYEDRALSAEAVKKTAESFIRPFDLNKAPLLRVGLVKVRSEKHILMLDMHHIISDGTSIGILTEEFIKLYNGQELPPLRLQYRDYAVWQNSLMKAGAMKAQEEYWLREFEGELPVLNLPTDYPRPAVQSLEGDNIRFELNREIAEGLRKIAKDTGTTIYMVLLAGFNILLSRYSGQEDIVVGSPIAGRPHADLESIIGMFVNTLAMRNYPEGNKTFREFLEEVRINCLKAYENQDYQFEELVDKLNIQRDMSRNPLFSVMLTLQDEELEALHIEGLGFRSYESGHRMSKFDITLNAAETGEKIRLKVEYCTKLFRRETIERLSGHLTNIFAGIARNADAKLSGIDMLSGGEKYKLLFEFNNTYAEYPKDKTVQELFEEQVRRVPDKIAAVYEDRQLTYRELNEKANRLAHVLRDKGVGPDKAVGIMVERSLEMVAGILGILKAGGAYLPIDPDYPEDRIRYMLEDSGAEVMLIQKQLRERAFYEGTVIELDDEDAYKGEADNIEVINNSGDLAYVMYTSGSTGRPKGVMIEHKGILRLVKNTNYMELNENDRIIQTSAIVFDVLTFEVWGALLNGASLYLISKDKIIDAGKLKREIEKNEITTVWLTAPLFNQIIDQNQSTFDRCDTLLAGGDALSPRHVNLLRGNNSKIRIINGYGPTENTTFTTCFTIDKTYDNNIPIGIPVSNTQVYIVDKNNNLQPIGVAGELCTSGDGLARGYLNKPELTREKFVPNPFRPGTIMYRTGDLARWLPDGNIEFLGRIDHQVKIRGFRIELGEIENRLLSHEYIKDAVVIVKQDENGVKYLCAYIAGEKELTVKELREYLGEGLPDYMIPAYFVQLEKMPLTQNGKVDRRALPEPEGSINTGVEYEEPGNETEQKLAEIWQEVLKIERVGINDNFFELGGHSLKATSLAARIHRELNAEVPLIEIFKTPTIKELAGYIKLKEEKKYVSIERIKEQQYYKLSSAQKRLYTLQQFDLGNMAYNMPGILIVEGRLDAERLKEAFGRLIERHEALRTSFELTGEEIVQKVHKEASFEIEYQEVSEEELEEKIKGFIRPFDLSKAPLLRVGLVKVQPEKHIMLFDMHHIISDGTSMGILTEELVKLYEGQELPDLRLQYKDYAAWQNGLMSDGAMKAQEEYWLREFEGELPVLNLPADYPRPAVQSFEGDSVYFELNRGITEGLREIAKDTGTTIYMVLLAGFNILLSRYSGQEDIVVGSPIAGRPHADLENIIGMFVNTLAMRNYPEGNKSFREFLEEVKVNCLKAYENQSYQFEELVDKLDLQRDMSRNPLFSVMLVLQNEELEALDIEGLSFRSYGSGHRISKFDITLNAVETEEKIAINAEYCTRLFRRETIESLAGHLENIFTDITEDTEAKLSEIDMLSGEEKHELLFEFNNTGAEYPKDKTIHELFEEQVRKVPDKTAAVYEDKQLTYRELNEKANRLAHVLRDKGVGPDKAVGIMVERSLDMVAGILGILKAGGAYLPIDPDYPADRIRYMLEDSGAQIVLTNKNCGNKAEFNGEKLYFEDEGLYGEAANDLEGVCTPNALAYVIYTSGTTGMPKGAMIEHRNVVRLMFNDKMQFNFDSADVWTMFHSFCFDFSVWEMYGSLLYGGKLVIVPKLVAQEPGEYLKLLKKEKVTVLNQTPTAFYNLSNEETKDGKKELAVRYVIFGGEALKPVMLKNWRSKYPGTRLINMYGITETTVHVTYKEITGYEIEHNISNIGKPIPTLTAYVLDKNMKLLPVGVAGELYVGGDGVGRGYLNRPSLTAEKFVENPYKEGERLYRSGDLVRLLPGGDMEYLGRIDHQVKIRGHRIELGEIENRLLAHKDIMEAVIVEKEDKSGNRFLCAYITGDKALTATELRDHLGKKLPDYMIPSYFIQLDKMPLTSNGKLDRRSLPEPEGKIATGAKYQGPRNDVERKLAVIWQDVLGVEKIGIYDSFFDLGGHSLKAVKVANLIKQQLSADISLRDIFECSSIAELSSRIMVNEAIAYVAVSKAEEQDYYALSYNQKRLLILNQLHPEGTEYNIYGHMRINGQVDAGHVQKTFDFLINRHESLRTCIKEIHGNYVQKIEAELQFEIESIDISSLEEGEKSAALGSIIKEKNAFVFDLSRAPLMLCALVKLSESEYELVYCMHHIISDGWSLEMLGREFETVYAACKNNREPYLEPLSIQYKDFAEWQNKQLEDSDNMKQARKYWEKQLGGNIHPLNLPVKSSKKYGAVKRGASYRTVIDADIKDKLKELAEHQKSSLFSLLLSGFYIYFAELTRQEDVIFGIAGSGRGDAELEKVFGYFVNTVVLRNRVDKEESYTDFLGRISDSVLEALRYQDYPLELLVDEMGIKYPEINVFINMLNMFEHRGQRLEDKQSRHSKDVQHVKFDLEFYLIEYADGIEIVCTYAEELFDPGVIQHMLGEYSGLLSGIAGDAARKVADYFD